MIEVDGPLESSQRLALKFNSTHSPLLLESNPGEDTFTIASTTTLVLGKALEERKAAQIHEQHKRPSVVSGRASSGSEIFLHPENSENALIWRPGKAF